MNTTPDIVSWDAAEALGPLPGSEWLRPDALLSIDLRATAAGLYRAIGQRDFMPLSAVVSNA